MKKYLLFFFACLSPLILRGQYHDANWISGAGYEGVPITPSNWIDFIKYPYNLSVLDGNIGISASSITLSSRKGELLLYSNGIQILNNQHEQLENGDSLSWGEVAQDWYAEGYPAIDGIIGLPLGQKDSIFYIIHSLDE
jgi:hypothetical protein